MNQQIRKQFIDQLQKDIVYRCTKLCPQGQKCFKACYKKYLISLNTVHQELVQYGYNHNSKISNKVAPINDLDELLYWNSKFVFNSMSPSIQVDPSGKQSRS